MKVFCIEFTEHFWVDAIEQAASRQGWEVCYWVCLRRLHPTVHAKFPGAILHDSFDAFRGLRPLELRDLPLVPLSEKLLRDMSETEAIALMMMDRMDAYGDFSYRQRRTLYQDMLRYWDTVIGKFSPDVVMFPHVPHEVFDYVIYRLCLYRGIKTVLFSTPVLANHAMSLARFEEPFELEQLYKKLLVDGIRNVSLCDENEKLLQKMLQGDYDKAMPSTMQGKSAFDGTRRSRIVDGFALIKESAACAYFVLRNLYKKAGPNYWKRRDKEISDDSWTVAEVKMLSFMEARKKERLRDEFEKRTSTVSLKVPYIYVPLHYQPELNTSPLGGRFNDMYLMVDMLARSVPDGWRIYVREHPILFSPKAYGARGRSVEIYDKFLSLPNVSFVSLGTSPWELIDNSKAVAGIAGTSGWEAVVRGKPCLLFGHGWYKNCEGVFYVPEQAVLKKALERIMSGYAPDYEKVRLFVYAVEQHGFSGYTNGKRAAFSNISEKENIAILANEILKAIDRYNTDNI